jgi:hypothetical protein
VYRAQGCAESGQAGFAAADGLIALTLVSMLAGVVAITTITGIRAMRGSEQRRLAAAEAEYRLLTEWPQLGAPGERAGRNAHGIEWRISATALASEGDGSAVCRVVSTAKTANSRGVTLQTERFCRISAR